MTSREIYEQIRGSVKSFHDFTDKRRETMPRKSIAQTRIELRLKSLGEDYVRHVNKRTELYEEADKVSEEIRLIEEKITDLQSLLDGEPEIIKPKEEKEDAIQE